MPVWCLRRASLPIQPPICLPGGRPSARRALGRLTALPCYWMRLQVEWNDAYLCANGASGGNGPLPGDGPVPRRQGQGRRGGREAQKNRSPYQHRHWHIKTRTRLTHLRVRDPRTSGPKRSSKRPNDCGRNSRTRNWRFNATLRNGTGPMSGGFTTTSQRNSRRSCL